MVKAPPGTPDESDGIIRDLRRQIAELRAENKAFNDEIDNLVEESCDYNDDIRSLNERLETLAAENARLRALPLKDEVGRMLEIARGYIVDDVRRRPVDYDPSEDLKRLDALLTRLRAGVQEGKQRFAVQSPTGAHVGLWETKAFADKIAKDEGPGYVVIELIEIAASPSVSDGESRNG